MKLLALAAATLFTASTGSMLMSVPSAPLATMPAARHAHIVDLPTITVYPDPADRIVTLPTLVVHPQPEDMIAIAAVN